MTAWGPRRRPGATPTAAGGRVGDPRRLSALRELELLDTDRDEAFDRLTRLAAVALDAPMAAVSLVDRDRQFFKSSLGMAPDMKRARETPLEASYCRHVIDRGTPLVIDDLRAEPLTADTSPVAEGTRAYAGVPLNTPSGHTLGTLCVMDRAPRHWSRREVGLLEDLSTSVMSEIELHATRVRERRRAAELEGLVARRTASLKRANERLTAARVDLSRSHEETIRRLAVAMELRSGETGEHASRVGALCGAIASGLGLSADRVELIQIASPLHDVGKIAIPDAILTKPGPLSAAERIVIETHAEIGHRMLHGSGQPLLDLAALMALTHHERVDGRGYPAGMAGERIPIEGRIVAVADVFDALTNERVYRPAMSVPDALAVMDEGRGSQFDRAVLGCLRRAVSVVFAGTD